MNKIITLFALLVIATSAHAWDIDYSKYTVKTSSVRVSDLYNQAPSSHQPDGANYTYKSADFWHSPDANKGIVLTLSYGSNAYIDIYTPKPLGEGVIFHHNTPNLYKLPPFIEMTVSEGKFSDRVLSICSGADCDRLIKLVYITYYTRNLSIPPCIETFNYVGKCDYLDGVGDDDWKAHTLRITPHVPTSQIPIYVYDDTEGLNKSCYVADIAIEYLQPNDEKAMGQEFAQAYPRHSSDLAAATFLYGNIIPFTTTKADISPADVNNDKAVNSADVVSVYNYIQNGENEHNGQAYVDLGLPSGTMWAACNAGALVPEGWGDLYAFGKEYSLLNGHSIYFTKDDYTAPTYNHEPYLWDKWLYPTLEDFEELTDNTTGARKTIYGVDYWVLTSNINGKQLVFPLAGYANQRGYHFTGSGYYRTQTDCKTPVPSTYTILFPGNTKWDMPNYQASSLRMVFKP